MRAMFYACLFATIVGGVLLVTSLIAGDQHGHGGGEVHGADAGSADHSHDAGAGAFLFSLRFWTYFLAFGGGVGVALQALAGTEEPLCALLAAAVGATSGAVASTVMRRLAQKRGSGLVGESDLVGLSGRLLLPVARGKLGRVRITVGSSVVDLVARTDDEELTSRTEGLLLEVKDGTALVTRNPEREPNGERQEPENPLTPH